MSLHGYGEQNDDGMMGMDQQDNLSDDDNAQAVLEQDSALEVENPLVMAVDNLLGRVLDNMEDVLRHDGVMSTTAGVSVHVELVTMLKSVLEVAAHTGPSIARTYARGEGLEPAIDDVYERMISDLVLPKLNELAQSRQANKISAALEIFRSFWKECHKAGSWLDETCTGPQAGPYGSGGHHAQRAVTHDARRRTKFLTREGEILKYWVTASAECTRQGMLSDPAKEGAVVSRAVIAASAAIRPSFWYISTRIKDTDDRGALRLFVPVMKMAEGVCNQLVRYGDFEEAARAACIKFLEIIIFCCSSSPPDPAAKKRGRIPQQTAGFSLEDLPTGHPIITREALESIAEYAFTSLRGLVLLGGQAKIDKNILSDLLQADSNSPWNRVVSILKQPALAYLEAASDLPSGEDDNVLQYQLDRGSLEFDYQLSQKSYAVAINALAAIASNRPGFFRESALCLARRAVQPPTENDARLTKYSVITLKSQLGASCLTLLRNSLSVSNKASTLLRSALVVLDMQVQGDKALGMAKQAHQLKSAGRTERKRANQFYQWDASDATTTRASRMDDELQQLRAAKKAKGLGHGIQLPQNMTEAIELIMENLKHLPTSKPSISASQSDSKHLTSLDSVVDAILTNGDSLSQQEGHWYERDGSSAWNVQWTYDSKKFTLDPKLIPEGNDELAQKRRKVFSEQRQFAASDAHSRILSSAVTSSGKVGKLSSVLAARLTFTLQNVSLRKDQEASGVFVRDSIETVAAENESLKLSLVAFVERYPLAACALAADVVLAEGVTRNPSICEFVLHEAYLQRKDSSWGSETDKYTCYDSALVLWISIAIHAGVVSNKHPGDVEKRKAANQAVGSLQEILGRLPRLTLTSVTLLSKICENGEVSKRAATLHRQANSADPTSSQAASHAAKVATERRAKVVLLVLRDIAFLRDSESISAVVTAVRIAAGRVEASGKVQEMALNFVVNVLYKRGGRIASAVCKEVVAQFKLAAEDAVSRFVDIEKANEAASRPYVPTNPLAHRSDAEKAGMDKMRCPVMLLMALCLRQPELLRHLFDISSMERADVLSRTVRINMPRLAKASATKYGATTIATQAAELSSEAAVPVLLSFIEHLVPSERDRNQPEQDIIAVCLTIQELKMVEGQPKDPRFLLPVVSAMLRNDLVSRLPEFVAAGDEVLRAALRRMGQRLGRQALVMRDEPDPETPVLKGMTLCEQVVNLLRMDFQSHGFTQSRYVGAIELCEDDVDVYNDQVMMSALDHISKEFLAKTAELPLGFMRSCIVAIRKHETLHAWMCHQLLPRLVDGQIYVNNERQWQGWMRCALKLDKEDATVSSAGAIAKLPPEQKMKYQIFKGGKCNT